MTPKIFTGFDGEIYRRANLAIAHGALTNSKRPQCLVKGVYPTHLTKGKGAFVWDTRGNKYIDFICGLGTSILGYANDEVNDACIQALKKGSSLSFGSVLEVETAERVKECFPWVERVRFLKTGTEACLAALRIARTKTGYKSIYSEGYHGWSDEFTSLTPPALGIPEQAHITKGDYPPAGTAALIVEPIITDASQARMERLREMRKRCDETKTVLIFDEIITGFRYPKFGVSNSAVEPDIVLLGKAIANGMPLSIVAGKSAVMECDEYFVSSTFAGDMVSLAAAHKTMGLLQTKYRIDYLWESGAKFILAFNQLSPDLVTIEGYPTRGVFKGEILNKALFWQECCKAGILFGPSFFFNFSHIELSDVVLSTCKDILLRIRNGLVSLEGELPVTPFAQKARQ